MCGTLDFEAIDDNFLAFAWLNLTPRARSRILAKSPKTFWVFGAGASHHYAFNAFGVPVPLANGFFEAFHRLPTSQGFHAHVGPFISFLEHYRGVPPDKVAAWSENIEEFMTSIEEELDALKESARSNQITGEEFERVISYTQVFNNMPFIFANVLNETQNGLFDVIVSVHPRTVWAQRHVCHLQLGHAAGQSPDGYRGLESEHGLRIDFSSCAR